jgi:IrrE N-terminal-like domain
VVSTLEKFAPSLLSIPAIEDYANRVGRRHNVFDDDRPTDIDGLMQTLGGKVGYAADQQATLHVRSSGDFTVFIPHFTSSRRDRFVVAHGIGHYFLHYQYPGLQGELTFGRNSNPRAETEADVFASALLMPAHLFRKATDELGDDYWKVAVRFDVSPMAAEIRAQAISRL